MKEEPLTGGREENFNDNLIVAEEENNTIYPFLGVELSNKQRRKIAMHTYLTDAVLRQYAMKLWSH